MSMRYCTVSCTCIMSMRYCTVSCARIMSMRYCTVSCTHIISMGYCTVSCTHHKHEILYCLMYTYHTTCLFFMTHYAYDSLRGGGGGRRGREGSFTNCRVKRPCWWQCHAVTTWQQNSFKLHPLYSLHNKIIRQNTKIVCAGDAQLRSAVLQVTPWLSFTNVNLYPH